MARKVFISVLGTGYYEACKYIKGSFCSTETRFIQQATLEYLKVCNNWVTKNADGEVVDRIIILLTDGAKETNWHKSIVKRFNPGKTLQYFPESLAEVLTTDCWNKRKASITRNRQNMKQMKFKFQGHVLNNPLQTLFLILYLWCCFVW